MLQGDEFLEVAALSAYAGFLEYGMGFVFAESDHDWGYIPFHLMPRSYRDYDPDSEFMLLLKKPDGGGTMWRVNCLDRGIATPSELNVRCSEGLGLPRLTLKELQRQSNIRLWIDDLPLDED